MKYIVAFIKKFILSGFILYGYNLIAVNFNMIIPINFLTIGFVALLGAPALCALLLFKLLILWGIYGWDCWL